MKWSLRLAAACGAVLALAACGKKGPPLVPFVRLPAAPPKVEAKRVGNDAYVTVTVPVANIDTSKPADVRRIEVYGLTATAMPSSRARALEIAALVATIPVAPGAAEGPLAGRRPLTAVVKGAATQGTSFTIRDPLTAEDFVARSLPAPPGRPTPASRVVTTPTRPEPPVVLRRFYFAVAYSDRGRPGPQSPVAELPLTTLPETPGTPDVRYTADSLLVSWEPAGGLLGFLLDRELALDVLPEDDDLPATPATSVPPVVPSSRPAAATSTPAATTPVVITPVATLAPLARLPPGPTRYHVYRELAPDPLALPDKDALQPPGTIPVQPATTTEPLDDLTFTEPVEFERARCYVIRAVRGAGADAVESPASERVCLSPVDVFPPVAPVGVSAVVADGAISLLWEPNIDVDLGGYLVLRGDTADATLLPITPVPLIDAHYTDTTVRPGRRYVYAVVAVDNRVPLPNVSDESSRVEETAR